MKIQGFAVKNKTIAFSDIALDFSGTGIHLIQGANGTGKTTILEALLFERNQTTVTFNHAVEQESYAYNRWQLIAYVPQNIYEIEESVKTFVQKHNPAISDKHIEEEMAYYQMEDVTLNQRFSTLSGGEKMKLSIIAALLKDTPYVVLDEPTNHLDDYSVLLLAERLSALKQKTLLIVCHDDRLKVPYVSRVEIQPSTITQHFQGAVVHETHLPKYTKKVPTPLILWRGMQVKTFGYLTSLVTLALLFSVLVNHLFANWTMNLIPLLPPDIIRPIFTSSAQMQANELYSSLEGLEFDFTNRNRITLNDVPMIAQMEGVKEILMADFATTHRARRQTSTAPLDAGPVEELFVFSAPEFVVQSQMCCHFVPGVPYRLEVLEGRLPRDGYYEMALSPLVKEMFLGGEPASSERLIGQEIALDGQIFNVVGVINVDVVLVSYNRTRLFNFYLFEEATFDAFMRQLESGIDPWIFDMLASEYNYMIIMTDQGNEREVLHELMRAFPTVGFHSYHSSSVLRQHRHAIPRMQLTLINLGIGGLIGLVMWFLVKQQFQLDLIKLSDLKNYYVSAKNPRVYYLMVYAFGSTLAVLGALGFSVLLTRLGSYATLSFLSPFYSTLFASLFVPFFVLFAWKVRNTQVDR